MRRRLQLALLIFVLAGAHQAQASPIQLYTDQSAWLSAATGITSFDFAAFAGPSFDTPYGSLTASGVTFTGAANYLYVRNSPVFMYGPGEGTVCAAPCGITISLPGGTTAVGWGGGSFYGNPVTVDINGVSFTGLGAGFIGFTSMSPITSLMVRSTGYPTLSSFSFGTATVPEPSTLLLLGGGLAAATLHRRRRTRP